MLIDALILASLFISFVVGAMVCADELLPPRVCASYAECSGGQQCVNGVCAAGVGGLTVRECFSDAPPPACSELPGSLLACAFDCGCVAGSVGRAMCGVLPGVNVTCTGARQFYRSYLCRYCFALGDAELFCGAMYRDSPQARAPPVRSASPTPPPVNGSRLLQLLAANGTRPPSLDLSRLDINACQSTSVDPYYAECSALPHVLCLGSRHFLRRQQCRHVGDTSWRTATLLSVFLGGLGADRFYLGEVGWGIFKLLSFGGVGIWTIVDAIAIAVGYVTPADGSLFTA